VRFTGPIYQRSTVNALRANARLYVHGHTVGGTNPSLVEALGAGSPVLAHDNPFNRGVAGPGAAYFDETESCGRELDRLLDSEAELERMRQASLARHRTAYTWERVLADYERCLDEWWSRVHD